MKVLGLIFLLIIVGFIIWFLSFKSPKKLKVIRVTLIIALCIMLSLGFSSIPTIESRAESTNTIEYELVPLENTETNKFFYLCQNNNGTYTYYYIGYNGINYYYQKGTVEAEAELRIEALPNYIPYPKITRTVNYIDQEEHISYTVYAPLDNVFEFKLDSGAPTSTK